MGLNIEEISIIA